jgi:hypothetical protein
MTNKHAVLVAPPTAVLDAVGLRDHIGGLDRRTLEEIREVLNGRDGSELQKELRLLVRAWQDSGPHLMYMAKQAGIEGFMEKVRVFPFISSDRGNVDPWFTVNPRRLEELFSQGKAGETRATAIALFTLLVHNPEWNKLAGPCPRCGAYYIKKRASQKVYCSRKCGNAATAVLRTSERYKSQREDKLHCAQAALQEWTITRTKADWKQFVSRRCREKEITPKFLTRAVNKGELKEPVHKKETGGKR